MSNLPLTHPYNSMSAAVDKHIGDAYPAVEAVAKRLEEIVYLAHHLADIQPRDIELSAATPQQEVLWRRAGETEWKLLATYQELLGTDLTTASETIADAIDRIIELERTQSDFWQKTPDPYEEGVTVTSPYYCVTYDGAYYSPNPAALPFFTGVFDPMQWRDLATLGSGGGGGSFAASITGNQAVTILSGRRFALYEVDADGKPLHFLPQLVGDYATLKAFAGKPGQVSAPTDRRGIMVHTGVTNEAFLLEQINNPDTALGVGSLAVGLNAQTTANALAAVAIGPNAIAQDPGVVLIGSIAEGVDSFTLNVAGRSTDAADVVLTLDGADLTADNSVKFHRDGIYDLEVTVIARQIGTNNCARFKRTATLRKVGNTTALLFAASPVGDANSNLPDLLVTLTAFSGGYFNIYVNGAVGKTIHWSGHISGKANHVTT